MKLIDMRPPFRYVRFRRPQLLRDDGRWTGGLVLGVLLAGCSSTLDPASGDPRLDLQHADPRVRIRAAEQAVRSERLDLCGLLVRNLSDRDGAVRLFSSVALRKLTGEDFDYKAYGTLLERKESIERWTNWLESKGFLARDAGPSEESAPPGPALPESEAQPPVSEDDPDPNGRGEEPREGPEASSGQLSPALSPAVPLDSAARNPAESSAPWEKKSAEKADDRWVGTSSETARS